jgi:hypothetical protein
MTEQVNRPVRLDIRDVPRDKTRSLGSLPSVLVKTFNYARQYPAKMAVLKALLKFMHGKCVENEKAVAAQAKAKAKG